MVHCLLLHGGGHGRWCWGEVEQHLSRAGVNASSFDLPGSGDDARPRIGIGLSDYIAATVERIDAIDDDILLVGHSIAGLTVPGVVASRPHRISNVLFIAALVCEAGERGIDSIPADRRGTYFDLAQQSGDDTFLPSFPAAWNRFFPSLDEATAREAYAKLTPQPLGPYLEPNPAGLAESEVPRTYVLLENDRTFPPALARSFANKAGGKTIIQAGDHCWMLTDPQACASAIAEVARA